MDRISATAGTLDEALRLTAEAKRAFTAEDITRRAREVLDLALRAGTTAMRSHVEVDAIVGLAGVAAMLALREEYAPALGLQLRAFALQRLGESRGPLVARARSSPRCSRPASASSACPPPTST